MSVCLFVPSEILETEHVSPRSFPHHEELCLVSCTNCLMSSLLEHEVVSALFAFLCGFNAQHHTHHLQHRIHLTWECLQRYFSDILTAVTAY